MDKPKQERCCTGAGQGWSPRSAVELGANPQDKQHHQCNYRKWHVLANQRLQTRAGLQGLQNQLIKAAMAYCEHDACMLCAPSNMLCMASRCTCVRLKHILTCVCRSFALLAYCLLSDAKALALLDMAAWRSGR